MNAHLSQLFITQPALIRRKVIAPWGTIIARFEMSTMIIAIPPSQSLLAWVQNIRTKNSQCRTAVTGHGARERSNFQVTIKKGKSCTNKIKEIEGKDF